MLTGGPQRTPCFAPTETRTWPSVHLSLVAACKAANCASCVSGSATTCQLCNPGFNRVGGVCVARALQRTTNTGWHCRNGCLGGVAAAQPCVGLTLACEGPSITHTAPPTLAPLPNPCPCPGAAAPTCAQAGVGCKTCSSGVCTVCKPKKCASPRRRAGRARCRAPMCSVAPSKPALSCSPPRRTNLSALTWRPPPSAPQVLPCLGQVRLRPRVRHERARADHMCALHPPEVPTRPRLGPVLAVPLGAEGKHAAHSLRPHRQKMKAAPEAPGGPELRAHCWVDGSPGAPPLPLAARRQAVREPHHERVRLPPSCARAVSLRVSSCVVCPMTTTPAPFLASLSAGHSCGDATPLPCPFPIASHPAIQQEALLPPGPTLGQASHAPLLPPLFHRSPLSSMGAPSLPWKPPLFHGTPSPAPRLGPRPAAVALKGRRPPPACPHAGRFAFAPLHCVPSRPFARVPLGGPGALPKGPGSASRFHGTR